jgi:hypothetical protein
MTQSAGRSPCGLAFLPVRFPFTFLGIMALAIGLWVVVYLITHPAMDPVSQGMAIGTAVISWGFGFYVLIRRVMRGPQH